MRPFFILLMCLLLVNPTFAQDETAPPIVPTPVPREYKQTEINAMMSLIQETYGIGFAYPAEWIANDANEVIWLTDSLHEIYQALNIASAYLVFYGDVPEDIAPSEFFRQHFDQANILIDRATTIDGGFWGNTLPMYENSQVIGYTIQLTYQGMSGPFVLIHELGHVLDNLLLEAPHLAFAETLGGEWTTENWIPGEGYSGNEGFFPRGLGGPNEDFADTFANMLLGYLTIDNIPVRFEFMQENLPVWLAALRELADNL